MLEELTEKVFHANIELVKHGLVIFTWGNVSDIDRETGLVDVYKRQLPFGSCHTFLVHGKRKHISSFILSIQLLYIVAVSYTHLCFAVRIFTVEVVDTVSDVGSVLNFSDERPRTNAVYTSRRKDVYKRQTSTDPIQEYHPYCSYPSFPPDR